MTSAFQAKKQKILQQLNQPAEEYNDLSPKGTIDEGIRTLIDEINEIDGLVTTSSCAGRISAFLEGKKKPAAGSSKSEEEASQEQNIAGPGGKGGGQWLFVSHDPIRVPDHAEDIRFYDLFGLKGSKGQQPLKHQPGRRYVHLKFEAMILHLFTASLEDAQKVLSAALQAGFRESGSVSLTRNSDGSVTPMVAVRSIGLAFDSVIGYLDEDGELAPVVDGPYLHGLVELANERFQVNTDRIARFKKQLLESVSGSPITKAPKGKKNAPDWEDATTRRERKRAEGLRLQQMKTSKRNSDADTSPSSMTPF